ncbi:hypothetical protein HA402_000544 [Bradysia odoriphaga]|nr:hypothetical protein HA402_000544 [Bradysia odoriphaga]
MSKHKSDIHRKKLKETTGLTIHAVTKRHTFDLDKATILDHIPNYYQRCIAEKMYIHKTPNNCNTQVDKEGLHKSSNFRFRSNFQIILPDSNSESHFHVFIPYSLSVFIAVVRIRCQFFFFHVLLKFSFRGQFQLPFPCSFSYGY